MTAALSCPGCHAQPCRPFPLAFMTRWKSLVGAQRRGLVRLPTNEAMRRQIDLPAHRLLQNELHLEMT